MRGRKIWGQGLVIILVLCLLVGLSERASAAPSTPTLVQTDWRTGELQVCWTGATVDTVMFLYVAKWDTDRQYIAHDFWVVESEDGCRTSKYYENGQTLWYYVQQYDDVTGLWGGRSNEAKQTPPITAYIINWPEMFQDLIDAMTAANNALADRLEDMMTPSDGAMQDLQDAVNGLKDALGVGAATGAGGQLQSGFDGVQGGMRPPIGVDDGDGTYTGGNTGGNLPYPNQNQPLPPSAGGGNLEFPNPDGGTDNEMTIRIPYGVDMQGNFLYLKILTNEQLEKMKWLNLARTIAGAIIFIMFGMWLVSRFSPQLKS